MKLMSKKMLTVSVVVDVAFAVGCFATGANIAGVLFILAAIAFWISYKLQK